MYAFKRVERTLARVLIVGVAVLGTLPTFADLTDRQWCRVRSPHFELVSDLDAERLRTLGTMLERFHNVAVQLIPGEETIFKPLNVLVFRSSRDFEKTFLYPGIAGFMQPALEAHLLIFGPDRRGNYVHRVAFHEYTHYLQRSRTTLNLPMWYEEGFAEYLSTTRFEARGHAIVGGVARRRFQGLFRRGTSLKELLDEQYNPDWGRHDLPAVYERSWALTHFLQHGNARGGNPIRHSLASMLAAMDAGTPARDALRAATGYGTQALDTAMDKYFKRSKLPTREMTSAVQPDVSDVDCLDEFTTHLVLGQSATQRNPSLAAALVEQSLSLRPDNVRALVALSRANGSERDKSIDAVERALDAEPADPGANVRMAELTMDSCMYGVGELCGPKWADAADYYRTALRSAPDRVDAAFGLGVTYLHNGQPGDAINYLKVAHRRAPWAPRINFYLGEAYRLTGNDNQARVHLTKTLNWDPDASWRERASLALSMLTLDSPTPQTPR